MCSQQVLISSDESSYSNPHNNSTPYYDGPLPHPIAWLREGNVVDLGNNTNTNGLNASAGDAVELGRFLMPGRMFYTSLGHLSSTWQRDDFQSHVVGGIQWVLDAQHATQATPSAAVAALSSSADFIFRPATALISTALLVCCTLGYLRRGFLRQSSS